MKFFGIGALLLLCLSVESLTAEDEKAQEPEPEVVIREEWIKLVTIRPKGQEGSPKESMFAQLHDGFCSNHTQGVRENFFDYLKEYLGDNAEEVNSTSKTPKIVPRTFFYTYVHPLESRHGHYQHPAKSVDVDVEKKTNINGPWVHAYYNYNQNVIYPNCPHENVYQKPAHYPEKIPEYHPPVKQPSFHRPVNQPEYHPPVHQPKYPVHLHPVPEYHPLPDYHPVPEYIPIPEQYPTSYPTGHSGSGQNIQQSIQQSIEQNILQKYH